MNKKNVLITILVDNTAGPGMMSEHGFSLLIETGGNLILFDTGQGEALWKNAKAMGKDLSLTDILILSHGHYDHSGAAGKVLQKAPLMSFYAHPGVVQPRYKIICGIHKSLQMPGDSLTALDKLGQDRLHWVLEPVRITPNVGVTGPIPRLTDYEDSGGPFYLDPQGEQNDPIDDDLALWIQTEKGVVICVGCAHSGLVNTINYIRKITGEENIRAIVGGFHLHSAGHYRVEQTITALSSKKIACIIPCHCTGERTILRLRDVLGDKVTSGSAGMTYAF